MKKYTLSEIMEKFYNMGSIRQCSILRTALSEMSSYNGRSEEYCIAVGMGFELNSDPEGTWSKAPKS